MNLCLIKQLVLSDGEQMVSPCVFLQHEVNVIWTRCGFRGFFLLGAKINAVIYQLGQKYPQKRNNQYWTPSHMGR